MSQLSKFASSRILQGTFLIDTTVSFQRIFNLPAPLRSASIVNIATLTLSVALGSEDVLFFSLPASTAFDVDPLDLAVLDVDIVKMSFTMASTAPAGSSFTLIAFLSKRRITIGLR